MHHLSICPRRENHISIAVIRCQVLVRFFALLRIKPHAPLLVRVPVNFFEFQPCGRTPQAGYLSRLLRHSRYISASSSIHRLGRGLPGYLILFAPHAFEPQRQLQSSKSPSPLVFLLISTHSTATLGIPLSSTALKSASFGSSTRVKPWVLHFQLSQPPTHPLRPVIPDNACPLRITAAAGT